ncbi:MAG: glutamine synthetase [Chlamydiales bacterium]|jgi:glutamine synthetase
MSTLTKDVRKDQSHFEKIVEEVKAFPGGKVKVAITDIDGVLRGKVVHIDKFLSLVKSGFGFCDVVFGWDSNDKCYDSVGFTGWHTGYPDAKAVLDLATYRNVPWDNNIPFFLADLEREDGSPLEISPRNLLKKVRQDSLDLGYFPVFAQEFEWFNFNETSDSLHAKGFRELNTLSKGMFGYSVLRATQNAPFFNDLFDLMGKFRIPIEGIHTETGPGVYEAAILYDDVLEAGDRAVLFKTAVKEIGHYHGIMPTFMAKWHSDYPGCSGHVHQSLWSDNQSRNIFYDSQKPGEPSDIMKSYIAGQLHCLPHILPMYAPTINSYKRLVEGHWAPTTLSWGIDNRTASIRAILGGEKSARVELRVPGSDVNPYLAMAASLASGLYGVKNKLNLEIPASRESAYRDKSLETLPKNLGDATKNMKNSDLPNELFGESFVKHFVETREWEWQEHMKAVTDWEYKRYFEVI